MTKATPSVIGTKASWARAKELSVLTKYTPTQCRSILKFNPEALNQAKSGKEIKLSESGVPRKHSKAKQKWQYARQLSNITHKNVIECFKLIGENLKAGSKSVQTAAAEVAARYGKQLELPLGDTSNLKQLTAKEPKSEVVLKSRDLPSLNNGDSLSVTEMFAAKAFIDAIGGVERASIIIDVMGKVLK